MNQTLVANSLKAGDVVARRYVVLRHLRDEACGGVWLAQDRSLGVDVGLKFLPRRTPHFEALRESLRREGALALQLRHPHILQTVHFEEGEEGVYLIQEPFQGESLLAHLNRLERFRLPYALSLLEQVSQALAFAHRLHEVHHALDPANLLIEDEGVKLANFACVPQAEESQEINRLELRAYVAPEVLAGEPVTPAANVFSVGVLGFRLAAGSLPYALTFDEPLPYRLESIPADLEEVPLPLQNLLLQCLAPDPRDRFEDGGHFLAALEQRRESFRTPSYGKWLNWTPQGERQGSGVMASVSRLWGQVRQGSKGAAGKLNAGLQTLKEQTDPDLTRRALIGLAGAVLALILLVWGGRALLRQSAAPPPPALVAPAPSAPGAVEATPPAPGGPPLRPAAEPAPSAPAVASPATPAAPRETKAPAHPPKVERYQLWVATYRSYDEALAMKKKIQARRVPVTVYRGAVDKKVFFAVKAGPFTGKKQAEDTAGRLKSELHMAQAPKLVKVQPETATPAKKANANGKTNNKTPSKTNNKTSNKGTPPKTPR